MQLYVIDTYSHIGQGGMKKNEWPKGVESKDIQVGLCLGQKGLE